MSLVVRCSLCGDRLTYSRSETYDLVRHLSEKHPEVSYRVRRAVKHKIKCNSPLDDIQQMVMEPLKHRKVSPRNNNGDRISTSGKKADENLPNKSDFIVRAPRGRRMYYKTSMAKWHPARTRVKCPECGETRFPTIRSTADRYSRSSFGAAWILSCWPFCFLPCLFEAPTKHHLHCSECGAYLGLYDPNMEVVSRRRRARLNMQQPPSHVVV
ncbi:uncharacterized protein LOC129743683 [Uranotaenia lowii]|uniref:uncharacterized protein LOC129743683 n=1 Tax=Uranotaenia lowii TaxID=190385 RepID=UPI0024783F7D|nr:uncharacterized protein LOC129743683 [Uranotaenia lowii]